MTWTLEARQLTRRSADGALLLREASAFVRPGDRIGVRGPSGAGKTVLLRALAGLDPIETGSLWWSGDRIEAAAFPRYRSRVVYVHQRPALVEGSVEDNLRLPFGLLVHRDKAFRREVACDLLATLGKPASFLTKTSVELSGGEAQIAALVRVLLIEPAVLLLDEPTASLDASSAEIVERALWAWVDDKPAARAVVCASHDVGLLAKLTVRQLQVAAGALVEAP